MARGTIKPPWDKELEVWEFLFIKQEPLYLLAAKTGFTEYRLRKSKKRFLSLSYSEWIFLPEPLQRVHASASEFTDELRKQKESGRLPSTPLQEEAGEMCLQGNHDWMISVMGMQRFKDHAFTEKVIREAEDAEGMVTIWNVKTCFQCGHEETQFSSESAAMMELTGEPSPSA